MESHVQREGRLEDRRPFLRTARRANYAILSYILHMWIPRAVEPRLQRSAKTRPVVVLTGARQTGKTSTFLRLFPKHAFVSLDLPNEAEQAEKEPGTFLQRHPPPVLIDEVQYAPGLFRHLKVAVDAHRTRNGQFLLTGSQKFTLMKNVSESLAGRADIVELETLSFAEIQAALPQTGIETAIVRGGFPELYANPDIDSVAFYNSYLATYLERDVRSLTNVGSLRDFERFLRACALRSANLLNKADLARDVGIAPSTANHWLSMLEASGQIVLLEPWFSNRTKSIVKSPKLYLADTWPALRSAEYSLRGSSSAVAGGGRSLGDVCFRPTSRPRTPRRADGQPLLLARPNPRSGLCGGCGRAPGTV